jgi:hypothetical protein
LPALLHVPRAPTARRYHEQCDKRKRRSGPAWFIGRRRDAAFQIRENSRTIAVGAFSLIG